MCQCPKKLHLFGCVVVFFCQQSCVAFRQIFSLVPATPGIQPGPSLHMLGMLRHGSGILFWQQQGEFTTAQPMEESRQIAPSPSLQSHGFCEQALTGKYFHCCTRSLALPNPAVSAPIIVPNHTIYPQVCFCLLPWAPSSF